MIASEICHSHYSLVINLSFQISYNYVLLKPWSGTMRNSTVTVLKACVLLNNSAMWSNLRNLHKLFFFLLIHSSWTLFSSQPRTTDAQWSLLFIKITNFWAWADNLGKYILGHLGHFQLIYQHPFWYCESLVHVFH